MRLLCLCPTYGRRRELLENTLACFEQQDYPADQRHLVLFDDLGTLQAPSFGNVTIFSQTIRCQSIAAKYRELLNRIPPASHDAVVVWDDDDIYLPWHLSAHAATLAEHGWSKPSWIWSAYHVPPRLESAAGRFHGSIAIRRDLLDRIGGWFQTKRADFDQQMIARLRQEGPPGDPCLVQPPGYVYRWQTTRAGHCSGLMRSPDNEDWYDRYQPDSREPIEVLTPQFDADAK